MSIIPHSRIDEFRELGQVAADILVHLTNVVEPGISTGEIEKICRKLLLEYKVNSPLREYWSFPSVIAISAGKVASSGIPSDRRKLIEGELVNLDLVVEKNGLYVDTAASVPVGAVCSERQSLLDVASEALRSAISVIVSRGKVSDIASAVSLVTSDTLFEAASKFHGHGVGTDLHSEPIIPHVYNPNTRGTFETGMAIALEPLIVPKNTTFSLGADGWAIEASSPIGSAFFEHTILVTEDGALVISGQSADGQWLLPGVR